MAKKIVIVLGAVVLTVAAVAVGLAGASARSARWRHHVGRTAASTPMCGLRTSPGKYRHVVWIFMENNSYGSIYGSSSAPYINGVAKRCGLATNYHNVSHPSLPNYIAATTGATPAQLVPFYPDCTPSPTCQWTGNNIFYQLATKGQRWRNYAESMPSPCDQSNSGYYAPRHNPAVYDTDLSDCATNDIPLGSPSSSQLLKDFSSSTMAPAFAFVTPNLCDDMHGASGCPSNLIQTGDNWLKMWLPRIASTGAYRAGNTVIFVTWDEGEPGSTGESCATNTSDQSCHVVTIVIAPSVGSGKRVSTLFNHYSLLKTAEQLLGLSQLGQAAGAASMVKPFNL